MPKNGRLYDPSPLAHSSDGRRDLEISQGTLRSLPRNKLVKDKTDGTSWLRLENFNRDLPRVPEVAERLVTRVGQD